MLQPDGARRYGHSAGIRASACTRLARQTDLGTLLPAGYWDEWNFQPVPEKDLVVLVADSNMEAVIGGLIGPRPSALGITSVTYDCFVHPRRDPGCLTGAGDFLAFI